MYDEIRHKIGEKWERTNEDGRKMLCECLGNGSGEWHCDPMDMCEHQGQLYMPDEKWTSTHDDGHRMICTCLGLGKVTDQDIFCFESNF